MRGGSRGGRWFCASQPPTSQGNAKKTPQSDLETGKAIVTLMTIFNVFVYWISSLAQGGGVSWPRRAIALFVKIFNNFSQKFLISVTN